MIKIWATSIWKPNQNLLFYSRQVGINFLTLWQLCWRTVDIWSYVNKARCRHLEPTYWSTYVTEGVNLIPDTYIFGLDDCPSLACWCLCFPGNLKPQNSSLLVRYQHLIMFTSICLWKWQRFAFCTSLNQNVRSMTSVMVLFWIFIPSEVFHRLLFKWFICALLRSLYALN